MNLLHRDKNHYSRTVAILFTHLFTYLKIVKMGPTVLFTYLKIILLLCFQFSVLSFSKNKFNPNGLVKFKKKTFFEIIFY